MQQRCLRLLARPDLGGEALVRPGQFPGSLRNDHLELGAATRQRNGRGAQRVAYLIEFAHAADQPIDWLAVPQRSRRRCERLDRPATRASHPPSQRNAQGERCRAANKSQPVGATEGAVHRSLGNADRYRPPRNRRPPEGGIDAQAFAGHVGKPTLDRSRYSLSKRRRCRLSQEALEISVACDDDAFSVQNSGSPLGRDVLLFQDCGKMCRIEGHRQHVDHLAVLQDRYPDRQDRSLHHPSGEQVGDVRLARLDDLVDRRAVSPSRGQLAIGSGGADDFLRRGVVETNGKSLDLQCLPDLACEGFHVAPEQIGRTRENLQGNLDAPDLAVDSAAQNLDPFLDVPFDLRPLTIEDADDAETRHPDQRQHRHEEQDDEPRL